MLAESYFYDNNYENAIRGYKKLMQLAWKDNNPEMETAAFQGMAMQYFYTGELEKASFLNDRVMRGKRELQSSKLRQMVMKMIKYTRELRYRNREIYFKDVHLWAELREQKE